MGILDGKNILVTGVIAPNSIAYHVARLAQEEGATVVLSAFGRVGLVERLARRLPVPASVIELDVTDEQHLDTLAARLGEHVDHLHGVLHSVAHAPVGALGGQFLRSPWTDVAAAVQVSAYSLQAVTRGVLPLMAAGGSIVGLDFDASRAWNEYDWMGVAKAGLESCSRYLASYLGADGIRVNLVAAGPLRTMASVGIGEGGLDGFARHAQAWHDRSPLGWDPADFTPVAKSCVVLLSDWLPATTGEILHVDGGAHAIGDRPGVRADLPAADRDGVVAEVAAR
jgi:enoyl-[acyl-carrier-protein] reductase (NADH)